jgi:hypothetical protein
MNPFFYGSAVTGDAFFGRQDQIVDLQIDILPHLKEGDSY